jgi:hypothetical protein
MSVAATTVLLMYCGVIVSTTALIVATICHNNTV